MGVTYKLTNEIIDFIGKHKESDPSVSCRMLAALVFERFNRKVSKSSISNVLKEMQLSSPVGRRTKTFVSKEAGVTAFRLPHAKKKELFSDISQQYILSDMHQSSRNDLALGMGNIFLKAAEWQLSSKPMLEDLMLEYSHYEEREKVKAVAAVLPFLKAFHIESFEGLARHTGDDIWRINEAAFPLNEADFESVLGRIKERKEFLLKFSVKAPQFFTKVLGFRCFLKDGTVFFLDARKACIWRSVQKRFSSPLSKSMDELAGIVNNVQSVVVSSVSSRENIKKEINTSFFDFFDCFENVQSKKIKKIEIINEQEDVLATFDDIPAIKRKCIVGIWPWDQLFHRFLDANKVLGEGKVPMEYSNRDLSYKEVLVKQRDSQHPLRGVMLFEPFMTVPFLTLATNWDSNEKPAQDVAVEYCRQWPNMEKGRVFDILSDPAEWKRNVSTEDDDLWKLLTVDFQSGRDSVWLAADQMLALLNHYAKTQFFPEEYCQADFLTMQHRFYDLPGQLSLEENRMTVALEPPHGYPYLSDLVFAVQQFNESGIKTFFQKRIKIIFL